MIKHHFLPAIVSCKCFPNLTLQLRHSTLNKRAKKTDREKDLSNAEERGTLRAKWLSRTTTNSHAWGHNSITNDVGWNWFLSPTSLFHTEVQKQRELVMIAKSYYIGFHSWIRVLPPLPLDCMGWNPNAGDLVVSSLNKFASCPPHPKHTSGKVKGHVLPFKDPEIRRIH